MKKCIYENDLRGIKRLVLEDANVVNQEIENTLGYSYVLPIQACLQLRTFDILKWIVEHGADVDKLNADILYYCIYGVPEDILQFLMKYSSQGNVFLSVACRREFISTMQLLYDNGYTATSQDFNDACAHGTLKGIQFLYQKGVPINETSKDGSNALIEACSVFNPDSSVEIVKFLLDKGFDVNKPHTRHRYNALFVATSSIKRPTKIIQVLLEAGANPNIQDKYGDTPLICCAKNGYLDMYHLLLQYNADPSTKNCQGELAKNFLFR